MLGRRVLRTLQVSDGSEESYLEHTFMSAWLRGFAKDIYDSWRGSGKAP